MFRPSLLGVALLAQQCLAWPMKFQPPPRGLMTWERFTAEADCQRFPDTCISESFVTEMADAMIHEGLVNVGYDTISLDDGIFTARDTRKPKTCRRTRSAFRKASSTLPIIYTNEE